MTLPRRKSRKPNRVDPDRVQSPGHRKWVRGFECSIAGKHECEGRIETAHVRTGTDGGMGLKPSDCWTLPLCSKAHAEQHSIGEPAFEKKYRISMKGIAEGLWKQSPHRLKLAAYG